jgi:rubrerythrin
VSAFTAAEVRTLHEALDDEYRAWATYDQVLADYGAVRPLSHIRDAEARHIEALAGLFERYGLALPANPWPGRVERYADLRQACEAGVAAEIANAGMYERLLAATQRPDLRAVLQRLQEASQQRHLPAFRRCAERGAHTGGDGGRHRRGHGGAR